MIDLNDPHCQQFIEAMASIMVYLSQQAPIKKLPAERLPLLTGDLQTQVQSEMEAQQ